MLAAEIAAGARSSFNAWAAERGRESGPGFQGGAIITADSGAASAAAMSRTDAPINLADVALYASQLAVPRLGARPDPWRNEPVRSWSYSLSMMTMRSRPPSFAA